jgi:hypothetical protein
MPAPSARSLAAPVAMLVAALFGTAGCGNTYRPVVSAINPVGPAGQPTKYAVAVSSASPTSNGLLTMVDFSGDTVLVTATLGVNPYYFNLNASGTTGYTLNSDHTFNSFDVSPSLITSQVLESTLSPGASPQSVYAASSSTYLADPGTNAVDQLTGTPPALQQELPIGSGYSPIYVVGLNGALRIYALAQSNSGGAGQAAGIELAGNTISSRLTVGKAPVYGVISGDGNRGYVLNHGDNTVSVINVINNALDSFPSQANANVLTSTIPVGTAPVWADFATLRDELIVANEGSGTTAGTVSIVNIPLCNSSSTTITNPDCNTNNPIDAVGFGQVLATVPVGINPIMVTVLSDATRAYVANAGVAGLPCAATAVAGVSTTCTISVVNLTSNTVTATIPINGHPAYIASANASPTGKVYVVCKDSTNMTVIETDTDSVDTTIPLQGFGISVRMTQP